MLPIPLKVVLYRSRGSLCACDARPQPRNDVINRFTDSDEVASCAMAVQCWSQVRRCQKPGDTRHEQCRHSCSCNDYQESPPSTICYKRDTKLCGIKTQYLKPCKRCSGCADVINSCETIPLRPSTNWRDSTRGAGFLSYANSHQTEILAKSDRLNCPKVIFYYLLR